MNLYSLSFTAQLLEGIGAILKSDGKKATAHGGNYQDNVTAALAPEQDHNATAHDDLDGGGMVMDPHVEATDRVLSGIEKVSYLQCPIPAVNLEDCDSFGRLSKQFVQALNAVNHGLVRSSSSKKLGVWMTVDLVCGASLTLILDMRTQWASTHQMLHTSHIAQSISCSLVVQDEHLTIMIQLIHLCQETRISTHLNSVTQTGSPCVW